MDFPRSIIFSDTEAGSLTMSYVCHIAVSFSD